MKIARFVTGVAPILLWIGLLPLVSGLARAQDSKCASAMNAVSENLPSASIEYNPSINNYYLEGNPYNVSDVIGIFFNDNSQGRASMSDGKTIAGWSEYLILSCSDVVMVQAGVRSTDWVDFYIWNEGRVRQRECIFSEGRLTPEQHRQWEENKWLYYICPG